MLSMDDNLPIGDPRREALSGSIWRKEGSSKWTADSVPSLTQMASHFEMFSDRPRTQEASLIVFKSDITASMGPPMVPSLR